MSNIKPIQTYYKGYHFRSRLEARWAVFFDALGIEWEYEPEGFRLPSGRMYLPDFRIKCYGKRGGYDRNYFYLYVEVKGEMTEEDAQKIREFFGCDYSILVVGNIPYVSQEDDVYDSWTFNNYEPMNGYDICPFNYELIDGDCFGAYPAATADGRFYLFGDDCNYINVDDCERVLRAYQLARSARFEHGEKG